MKELLNEIREGKIPLNTKVLQRIRAKGIYEALRHGFYENGNHYIEDKYGRILFYYRGTLIATWDITTDHFEEVYASELYTNTSSTRQQRREIKSAVEQFNEWIDTYDE